MQLKNFIQIVTMILLTLLSFNLNASTDCQGIKITQAYIDSEDNYFYIDVNGNGLNGKMSLENNSAKFVYATALSAVISGKSAWVRYSANNINCSNAAWNEVIQGIGIYN